MAKFWLVAQPTEPADLQPAAGAASTAQALAALQGNSWKGRRRQRTWGHYSMSPQNSEKQSPPLLHLSYPGKEIYLGSFLDTSRLKHVGTLFTWMQLPGRGDIVTCHWKSGSPQSHSTALCLKPMPRPFTHG